MARVLFTLTGLREYLNDKYAKKSKKIFSDQDVYGYVMRGNLPDYLGGTQIKRGKQLIKGGSPVYYLVEKKQ